MPDSSPTYTQAENNILSPLELGAYFERIEYAGSCTPSLETLSAIHRQHAASIPFENLNPLLGLPVKLDVQSLQQKMITDKRGGYCFEQNLLLSHVLKSLRFDVRWLSARVLWNRPVGVSRARTHMLLLVYINNEAFIADVGFGGLTLTSPIKLEPGIEQTTNHESFRLIEKENEFILEAKIKDEWKALYSFSLQEQLLPDYEVTSYYLCHYPESHFINMLRAARSAPGYRYALNNNEFAIHHLNGPTERKILSTAEEVMNILETVFLIKLPGTAELKKRIEALLQTAAQ
jgi:N-hydroxyarylamine O-acetyltransferase